MGRAAKENTIISRSNAKPFHPLNSDMENMEIRMRLIAVNMKNTQWSQSRFAYLKWYTLVFVV